MNTRAAVVRALALWETWIIMATIFYVGTHFMYWSNAGFPVVGR